MSPLVKYTILGSSLLSVLAGAWLIAGTWALPGGYPVQARCNNVVIGAVVVAVMSLKCLFPTVRWPGWAGIVLGLWVMYSPWALGYATRDIALRNDVATAIGLIIWASVAVLATITSQGTPGWDGGTSGC